ncbi:hypothetical protein ACHAO4_003663 [Trichoderma viride]
MGRCDFLRKLLRNLGIAASPSQSHEDEEGANLGIRPFPLRADLPPPEKSGAVRHVDIIAVHGLGGNWLKTWRADDGAIWLRDRVPQLLAEKKIQARVLSYGYNADVIFTNTINTIDIVAGDLLSQVYSVRTTDEQKKAPIIFVAHSLGGLVVKAAINKAWTENMHYQNIVDKATGCIFLSMPHRDANLARWARHAATIMKALTGHGNKRLVLAISRSSNEWKRINQNFVFRAANMFIATFHETQPIGSMMDVDQHSAILGLPEERIVGLPRSDHRNICKFGDSPDESDRFFLLGSFLTGIVESALERGQ